MLEAAKRLLETETRAMALCAERLDGSFAAAMEILVSHGGKVVVCGMGKSGHIAKKIAATFTSIGQPSIFLHPSEGAHGDLGVYSPGDPTILLSKSGTTDEILCLIPTLKKFKSPIISIVGNVDSPLAAASDVVIDISFAKEADPLQIVPTTSAIVSLAIGDAMAAELMARKSITKQQFAVFHPAGQLGRNLLLRVRDVMTPKSSCAVVKSTSTLAEVVIAMTECPLGAALVIDGDGILAGLITDGDIRRSLRGEGSLQSTTAGGIMTRNPRRIHGDDHVGDAVVLMESGRSQISVLPVVDGDAVLGLLRLHDTYSHSG